MSNDRPIITYQLQGQYSYERETEPEIEYLRFIAEKPIDEWIEHALQLVIPYTHVRLVLEVYG